LVPRIHLNNLDTRDKPEYDIKKEHKYDEEENLPEYDIKVDVIPRLRQQSSRNLLIINRVVMPIFCTAKNSRHLQINISFLIL
ncbi:MAG: hypothetical protein IJX20_04045, partial [Alphaproteobacteria bacterium]|nr:hypothetical protein [Alphaproteobacteria bacterium]